MKVKNIGRSENADIVINNPAVSRRHAVLRFHWNGKMEIVDLSSNGTSVNNNPIKSNAPYPVKKGDVIVFANSVRLDWTSVKNPYLKYWIGTIGVALVAIIVAVILAVSSKSNESPVEYEGGPETGQIPTTIDTTTKVRPHKVEEIEEQDTISSPIDRYIPIPEPAHKSGKKSGGKKPTPVDENVDKQTDKQEEGGITPGNLVFT